ncbi:MAG: bifunctional riboflavin kinase/FAD synthetase [Pleurocapsa sp.]
MLIISDTKLIKTPTAIALGNFDGIHRGHQIVLQPIANGLGDLPEDIIVLRQSTIVYPSVVSFSPHPREFFTGQKLQLLTPVTEKAEFLAQIGIEQLILLPFDQRLASLTPQEFVADIIVKQLQAKYISVGEDFRFGNQRKGTALDLKQMAANWGVKVHLNTLHKCRHFDSLKCDREVPPLCRGRKEVRISSSLIRQALLDGQVERANFMLGRPYQLIGKVVAGQQLGRTIGFPTANLQLPADKFLPRYGVYAVEVLFDCSTIKGVMNIGCRPTVAGEAPTVEVHLLNWSGDLYGQTLKVSLKRFLRTEQKFPSLDALKQQITIDCQAALAGHRV